MQGTKQQVRNFSIQVKNKKAGLSFKPKKDKIFIAVVLTTDPAWIKVGQLTKK